MAEACVETEELTLEVIRTACEVGVTWLGRAEGPDQADVFGPVLEQLLVEAKKTPRPVKMHFEGVKHFNSTTLMHVMTFLTRAEADGVRVVVTYDADRKWQRLAFRAVERMGLPSDLVEVHGL
ncbi:MAG: hypothetical protein AAF602_26255 [Myxococcota bacterium]